MTINVWGYIDEFHTEKEELLAAVDEAFESGQLILGKNVQEFETEFARYCDRAHCVGVDNGTNALVLALFAIGVEPGDEVITVSNTAAPTVVAIANAGAVPRFVDIDPVTYLMDTSRLEAAVTPRTKCILPVHLYGQCVDMSAVHAVAQRHGLRVLEDCAQAHGATHHGRIAGSMSDAAGFSFYPTKVLGAYGDGGAVVTSSEDTYRNLRRLRYYGMDQVYYVVERGFNARLDEVHAAMLRKKLPRIGNYIARRQQIAERYVELLAETSLVLPKTVDGNTHVYYVYVARHPKRDRIIEEMGKRGVNLNVSYRWPCHTMTGFARFGYRPGDLPHTEAAADEIFSLPMYPSLTDAQQDYVCEQLRSVLAELHD